MLGWLFGGLVKKCEYAAKDVSQDFLESTRKEVNYLFDTKLYPLADKLDYIARERIKQSIDGTEKLESRIKVDIESLLANADDRTRQVLEKINQVREEAIQDLQVTIGQTDVYLENRINQISLVVMEVLKLPQEINRELVEPTLTEINVLENKLFRDADRLVDKIDEALEGKLEQIRLELRRYLAHALPGPFDRCRQRLKLAWKPGAILSDIELYELRECYELNKLNENTSIDEVLKTYGQLQLNAARMAALVKNAPELKRRAIQDWLKYGVLCEFWRNTVEDYTSTASLIQEPQPLPRLQQCRDEQNL